MSEGEQESSGNSTASNWQTSESVCCSVQFWACDFVSDSSSAKDSELWDLNCLAWALEFKSQAGLIFGLTFSTACQTRKRHMDVHFLLWFEMTYSPNASNPNELFHVVQKTCNKESGAVLKWLCGPEQENQTIWINLKPSKVDEHHLQDCLQCLCAQAICLGDIPGCETKNGEMNRGERGHIIDFFVYTHVFSEFHWLNYYN